MSKASLLLMISASLLLTFGLVMIFDTTAAEAIDRSLVGNTHSAFLKQILYALCGLICGIVFYVFGWRNLIRQSSVFLFILTIFLILVFIPKIGHEINGAKRWINLFFGISFQPSEIAKYLIPVYFINRVIGRSEPFDMLSFFKVLAIISIPLFLILLEPDNGSAAIIFVTLAVLFFLVKIRWTYWALPLLGLLLLGGTIAYQMPHVHSRLKIYLHPETDIQGKGHQPYQAKIAAGSGKFFGRGLGESIQKMNYLPEARSDYIAAIYAEEFGFLGVCFLISLYMLIAYAGYLIAAGAKERGAFYLAAIFSFLFSFQAFLNLGIVSGLLPSKGTTLPFFSQGGTSLIVNMIALFILFNIAKEEGCTISFSKEV